MPLRFTRRRRILPGLRVNFSKSGASLSAERQFHPPLLECGVPR
jgi:hypothetical protein